MTLNVARLRTLLLWLFAVAAAAPAMAQAVASTAATAGPAPQTPAEAVAQDAASYAIRYGLAADEAVRRLGALQASAAQTDALRRDFRERLVGISIEHRPSLQIVVLL